MLNNLGKIAREKTAHNQMKGGKALNIFNA